ncbi:hypothetical protein EI94DRAFT_1805956 [Lactarius quietus]|nr:hypothetical protein EI94DRAFT_1805956 [Lactarius quietus]
MLDDGHDTTIDYAASWLDFWLLPLLNDTNFNDNHTLILITFDETDMYIINHQIHVALLEGAIPGTLPGTVDSTYCTHYFPFPPLRQTGFSVRSAAATQTKHSRTSSHSSPTQRTTQTSTSPYVRFTAPNTSAVGAGGSPVFVGPGIDTNLTAANAPAAVNLTAKNETVLWSGPRVAATKSNSTTSEKKSGALGLGGYCRRQSARRAFGGLGGASSGPIRSA